VAQFSILFRHLTRGNEKNCEKESFGIVGVPSKIRIWNLPNIRRKYSHFQELARLLSI